MGLSTVDAKTTSRSGGAKREFQPKQNVLVQIEDIPCAKNKAADPKNDFLVGYLIAPAFGLEAGAEVKVKLGKTESSNRREIHGFARNMGMQKKVEKGGIVEFQSSFYLENENTIVANWPKVLVHNPANGNELAWGNVVMTVGQVYESNGTPHQKVTVYETASAPQITSQDDFWAYAQQLLIPESALQPEEGESEDDFQARVAAYVHPGNAAFLLSAYDSTKEAGADKSRFTVEFERRRVKEGEDFRYETFDEIVARMTNPDVSGIEKEEVKTNILERAKLVNQLIGAMDSLDPGDVMEVIPATVLRVGSMTAQAALAVKDAPIKERRSKDPAVPFSVKQTGQGGKEYLRSMFATGNVGLKYNENTNSWSVTHANTTNAWVGDVRHFHRDEIITPNTPEAFAAAYLAAAEERAKKPETNNAPANEGEQDLDQDGPAPRR
jgi:hypothetical protein